MSNTDDTFHDGRLAFHGRIVAGATHEIQNHFAVIKEYSGLIGDLLRAGRSDIGRVADRCAEITRNINDRANAAAELVDALNSFAHRGDEAVTTFRAEEAAAELVALLQRSAARRIITLDAPAVKGVPAINNNPSLLDYLLFLLIMPLMDEVGENGRISVSVSPGEDGAATIRIIAEGASQEFSARDLSATESVTACLDRMATTLVLADADGGHQEIVLTILSLAGDGNLR